MNVLLGVSNRHIHLNNEDYKILFGDIQPEKVKDLVQPGQYASNLKVSIKTEKNTINNVRVLMPIRSYTQVEISKTDSYTLGIKPPIRASGDLEGAAPVTIVGPCGEITRNCAIIAERHIHIDPKERERLGFSFINKVSLKVGDEKRAILHDVYFKDNVGAVLECHIDTDDANANLINNGDYAEIILD